MANGKWIEGLKGDMPLVRAARHVLEVRLDAVAERLPKAIDEADEDIEHVHQLRVGTRRAGAAVRIFEELLPPKIAKRLRRALRDVRRAAGAARDWDVFLEGIMMRLEKGPAGHKPALDLLSGIAHAQRMAAQEELHELKPGKLTAASTQASAALRLPETAPKRAALRDLAVPHLQELLNALAAATAGDLADYEHLHQVRILGKRLRYAMEVFAPCFAAAFRDTLYPVVEEMQEILGLANDSHVASQKLAAIRAHVNGTQPAQWQRYQPGLDGVAKFHVERLAEQRQRFLDWLARWRQMGAAAALAELAQAKQVRTRRAKAQANSSAPAQSA